MPIRKTFFTVFNLHMMLFVSVKPGNPAVFINEQSGDAHLKTLGLSVSQKKGLALSGRNNEKQILTDCQEKTHVYYIWLAHPYTYTYPTALHKRFICSIISCL
jgi:hypothetical protein